MDNKEIANVFDELADLLEFQGENPFRIRAYRNGSRAIRELDVAVAEVVADPDRDLAQVPGIGKTLAEKAAKLLEKGTLPQLEDLREQFPASLLKLVRVPNLGAKKAASLHRELGIESLAQLRDACNQGKVRKLKGFGAKTEQSILEGLAIAEAAGQRIRWAEADAMVLDLLRHMRQCSAIQRIEAAGSYRRGKETVGDVDLLAVASDREAAMDHFAAYPETTMTMLRGETKSSIRIGEAFQVDLRCVDANQFGAALQYFTGSKEHNVRLRSLARKHDLKVNEYGVFNAQDEVIAGREEADVYAALGLPCFPPELREDRIEFEAADHLPDLVTLDQMRGDLHMHTSATDGKNTIREMADAALQRGLAYIAITDHSQRLTMANGLDAERLREQWSMIDEIRPEYAGRLEILKGIECDILEDGPLDLPDDVLAEGDWIIASVHYGQKQPRQQITDRIIGALENPFVDVIAHPTGRLINRRPAYEVDMEAVMDAAAAGGKCLELNANPARLDLHDLHLLQARKKGIPIVISTDAHSTDGLDVMRYGILQARRGGCSAADIANTRSWTELLEWRGRSPK